MQCFKRVHTVILEQYIGETAKRFHDFCNNITPANITRQKFIKIVLVR